MTFFPPLLASSPIATHATRREHYRSVGDAAVTFWASSLRSALVSQQGADPHPFAGFLAQAARNTPINNAELERWDLLSALGETCAGPPTAVQLALLDHLAPADPPRLTH